MRLGVVILAAGASSRMGCPKLLLPWGDTSVVGHLIGQWQALGAEQIAIVCRGGDATLDRELDRLAFPRQNRIVNPEPERGMFSSILCAANWEGWQRGLTAWALVLGDQPHLREETLRTLLEFSRGHPDSICQPEQGGRARHPVILPRRAMAALAQMPQVRQVSSAECRSAAVSQTSPSRPATSSAPGHAAADPSDTAVLREAPVPKQSHATTLKEFLEQTDCPVNKCRIEDTGLALDLDRLEDYRKALNLHHA